VKETETKKNRPMAGFFKAPEISRCRRLAHALDVRIHAALMASRLVRMDQAFASCTIDTRNGILEGLNGSLFIACLDRLDDLFHEGPQGAPLRGVLLTAVLRLTGALAGLW
jgi:hypothetical protein